MSRLPIPRFIQEIKTKLGFDRTMTAPGSDVVDAVNKQAATDNALEGGLAIIANGDAHGAIGSGQYVYVKNHSSLAEGLYRNTSSDTIGTNVSLVGKLTASSNSLNELLSNIAVLNKLINNVSVVYYGEIIQQNGYKDFNLSRDWYSYLVITSYSGTTGLWIVTYPSASATKIGGADGLTFSDTGTYLRITSTAFTRVTIVMFGPS